MPTDQDLRRALIVYRETVVRAEGNRCSRERSILRRAMIDHLIEWKPVTEAEWLAELPSRLAVKTDPTEFGKFAPAIVSIVRRHLKFNGHLRLVG